MSYAGIEHGDSYYLRREEERTARLTAKIAQLEGKLDLVKQALQDDMHVVVLKQDGWFIRHSLKCREVGGDCLVNRLFMKRNLRGLGQGTFHVGLTHNGPEESDIDMHFSKVTDGYDPMLHELRRLGMW